MPRLRQVPRSEAAPSVLVLYDMLFGDRDPVGDPGTATGTPGDWWTVFAVVPECFEHAVAGFGFYRSPDRLLDPRAARARHRRRAGWARGSQFVFSQHCKSLRTSGVTEEKIAAIPHWQRRRLLLADRAGGARLHRLPRARRRSGRRRRVRRAARAPHRRGDPRAHLHHVDVRDARRDVAARCELEYDDRDDPIVEVLAPGDDQTFRISD